MQKQEYETSSLALQTPEHMILHPIAPPRTPQHLLFTCGFDTTRPPATDPATIMQRADEVNALQRMLSESQTSVVTLTGSAGAGKATLAALLFQRLQHATQTAIPALKHLVWLRIGPYSTLPDVIAAILSHIHMRHEPTLFLQTAEQQIDTLIQTLSRPQESALIILDAFDRFLDAETHTGLTERGAVPLFLERLQSDLGGSRILLICHHSPYKLQNIPEGRVRSYLVSRINIPEGVALLQQRGVQGSYEDLSLVWQRCGGHVYSLVLFSTLHKLSRFPLSFYLHSSEYHSLWNGAVTSQLGAAVYRSLNPVQRTLLRTLSIFQEPVPMEAIEAIVTAEQKTFDLALHQKELATLLQLALVRQTINQHNIECYWLHPLLQHYSIDHYLSGIEQQQGISISLGVSGPLTPILPDKESERIALATTHLHAAAYYQQLMKKHPIPRENRTNVQDIEPIVSTIRHLCLGWHWQQAYDVLVREGLYESMMTWGAWNSLIHLYSDMLPPLGVLTRRDEGLVYNHLGLLHKQLGDHQRSYAYFEEALALQRKIGDIHGEATSLTNEGELFRMLGARKRARTNFEQALQLNTTLQDSLVDIVVQHNLGLLYHTEKNDALALRCYIAALQLAEQTGETHHKSTLLTNIGVLLFEQGYQTEALAIMLYVLKARERLQYSTIDFITSFTEALKNKLDPHAFTQICQAALSMQEQVIARLLNN